MAEIIGLIASVISIIEGINKANGFVRKHVHTHSSIRKELVPMLAKVTAFAGLLQAVKLEAEFEEHDQARLKALAHIDGPLYACKDAAKAIENRLDRIISVGNLSIGKLLDKECLSALNILDQTKPILELALLADQRTLLSSIESYIRQVAGELQELRTDSNGTLQRLHERSATIEAHIVQIRSSREDSVNLKHQERIIVWTCSLNHKINFHAARKHTAGVPGTGRWFIDSSYYRKWTSQLPDTNAILLQGILGAGKTVLSSTIIEEIMQTTPATNGVQIAYFFFDFNDSTKQTVESLLRSLVFQLAVSVDNIPMSLESLYAKHHHDRRSSTLPTTAEWASVLLQLLSEKEIFYIVIDALDDCLEEERLIESLNYLVSESTASTRWLFTCRISEEVSLNLHSDKFQTVRIKSSDVDRDIATYLHATLENDPKLRSYALKAKTLIRFEIQSKARGMFRWAQCQIDSLRQLKDRRLKTVQLALSHMPEDLNASYERTLLQLCSFDASTTLSNERLVFRILIFVAFSGRPVTVEEVAEFAVIENSAEKIEPDDRFEDPLSVLAFVGSLISMQDSIMTLAHKSVKDFLESPRALYGPLQLGLFLGIPSGLNTARIGTAADIYIAQKCLGYLALPHTPARQRMLTGDVKDPNITYLGILQRENQLLDYAASMWPYHVREPISQQRTRLEMDNALRFNCESRMPTIWQGWLFLQRADIWERQLKLASYLCECFIRSSLMDGWANNFWYYRQCYRVTNTSSPAIQTDGEGSARDTLLQTSIGQRSKQFHDLALLLLEIAFQKPMYVHVQVEMQSLGTIDDVKAYVKQLKDISKDVIPRMGEGYHEAVFECLELVMHKDTEGFGVRPLFQMQSHIIDTILQPLRSSASSGFRHSRGKAFDPMSMKNLYTNIAKFEAEEASHRFSDSSVLRNSGAKPLSNSFYRTHGPDGSLRKTSDAQNGGQTTVACRYCKMGFPSEHGLTSHKTRSDGFCSECRICLPSISRSEHDKYYHSTYDLRWSLA